MDFFCVATLSCSWSTCAGCSITLHSAFLGLPRPTYPNGTHPYRESVSQSWASKPESMSHTQCHRMLMGLILTPCAAVQSGTPSDVLSSHGLQLTEGLQGRPGSPGRRSAPRAQRQPGAQSAACPPGRVPFPPGPAICLYRPPSADAAPASLSPAGHQSHLNHTYKLVIITARCDDVPQIVFRTLVSRGPTVGSKTNTVTLYEIPSCSSLQVTMPFQSAVRVKNCS